MRGIRERNAITVTDFYKMCHREMYPQGMTKLYSTWTPRSNKFFPYSNEVVWFGLQGFMQEYLLDYFDNYFFKLPLEEVLEDFKLLVGNCFDPDMGVDHIKALHKLGYLPVEIKALPEGTLVPINTPMMTIENTHPDFAWLTNFLETFMSQNLWSPTTTATIAYVFNHMLQDYLEACGEDVGIAKSLFGDFSPRGMSSSESSKVAGAGHLLSSVKTSAIEAIRYMITMYDADLEKEKVGEWSASVEHSCVCSNFFLNNEDEEVFFNRLLTEVYTNKPFTYVADSFDFWAFVSESLPKFKDIIMARDTKVCIRPDSGIPELILCGDLEGETELERRGLVEVLWEIFGGTVNAKGYKKLDSHIGIVYGDSITLDRCKDICERLLAKGFCVNNVVFGVGSYTYNMISRDTLGHALKATYCEVNGKAIQIFKNPKTDKDAMKKSQKGKVAIVEREGKLTLIDQLDSETEQQVEGNMLETVFRDGKIVRRSTLNEIRNRVHDNQF
ncbi:MAG: nicotinate phosphoribosyltransferase [Cellulosilyticaceae bacterium]